jgi:hypothetical protein
MIEITIILVLIILNGIFACRNLPLFLPGNPGSSSMPMTGIPGQQPRWILLTNLLRSSPPSRSG